MGSLFLPDLWLSIFVDELAPHGKTTGYHGELAGQAARVGARNGHQWCHMFAAQDSPDHLHAFAAGLGLKRAWCDGDHYDLTPGKRAMAVRLGATETDIRTYSYFRRSRRAQKETLPPHEAAGGLIKGEPEPGLLYLASLESPIITAPNPTLVLNVLAARFPLSVRAARERHAARKVNPNG